MNKKKKPQKRELSDAEKKFLAGLNKFDFSVVNIGGHQFDNTESVFSKER